MTAEKQNTRPPDTRARERLPSLTGLRFVAAFLVFGFHLHVAHLLDTGAAGTVMEWVFGQGAVGVSFFFILSGFVLTWSVRAVDTPRRFWQRRFAKIYPNHVATWIVALMVALVTGAGVTAAVALPNLVLVQAWFPNPDIYYGMNSPSWSLACEALFYALFVPLYAGFVKMPARALWPATWVALALVWLVPLIAQVMPDADDRYWFIYVFPPSRLPEFAAGMLLALVVRAGRWPHVSAGAVGVFAVVTYLVSRLLPEDIHYVAVTAIPLALLIAAIGAGDAEGRPSPWRARWMIWLGETSFAFYLVHQLAVRLVVRFAGDDRGVAAELAISLACLGIAILGSWALYRIVEVPGMRLLRPRRAVKA